MKIYNPTDIGDRNKLMILRLIKVYDGISRQEISKRMHLSAPAVSNNVAALIENGIVYENGCDDTSLGRKPRQLSYKGDHSRKRSGRGSRAVGFCDRRVA